MKYLYTFFIAMIMLFAPEAQAQTNKVQTFEIIEQGEYAPAVLTDALLSADMDKYRKLDSRSVLHFQDGSQISLLSFNELYYQGLPVSKGEYLPEDKNVTNTFAIRNGQIIEVISPAPSMQIQKVQQDSENMGGNK